MNKIKSKFIMIIVLLIVFISSSYITLDLARLSVIKSELMYKRLLYTDLAKLIVIILSATLIFIIGKDGLSSIDTTKLKLIYIFIILADFSLVMLENAYLGIFLFALVQVGLIFRNGSGILVKFKNGELKLLRSKLFINTILSTIFGLVVILNLFSSLLKDQLLLYFMVSYALILSISLWTAIANPILGLFPRLNSILISIGMILFVLCDLNVGLSFALKLGTGKIIADSIVWIFYTPALTLVALSGYNYHQK